jgi:hypothetical protein
MRLVMESDMDETEVVYNTKRFANKQMCLKIDLWKLRRFQQL